MERQGSVRRAREMLEAGVRPQVLTSDRYDPSAETSGHGARPAQTPRFPFSNESGELSPISQQPPYAASGYASNRLPAPNPAPSPSVYSDSANSSEYGSNPAYGRQPVPSFSQPFPHRRSSSSTRSDYTYEQPGNTGIASQQFPGNAKQIGGLTRSSATQHTRALSRTFVSPIPEESPRSHTPGVDSHASSQVIMLNSATEPAEPDGWETRLEDDSDGHRLEGQTAWENGVSLVRRASAGSRAKPSVRDIQKQRPDFANDMNPGNASQPGADMCRIAYPERTTSSSTRSSDNSEELDLEKAHFVLDMGQPQAPLGYQTDGGKGFERTVQELPPSVPTLSATRPGGHRPPQLNLNAVRQAEARGSLTSLSDLIKRATRLASNLDRGRTASRLAFFDTVNNEYGPHQHRQRNSGSISDLLNSFPNPAGTGTPQVTRSSWPVFLKRPSLHIMQNQDEIARDNANRRRRSCCGMPTWLFALICVVVVLVVAAAILVPIILIVLPRQNASTQTLCEKSNPCLNGGASISSGNVCSCVCTNGFTGQRCTIPGDASCVTANIASKNVTVGTALPRLFAEAQNTYNIPLDATTILAMFSSENLSCATENALVSFAGVQPGTHRRWSLRQGFVDDVVTNLVPRSLPAVTPGPELLKQKPTLVRRDIVSTTDGILIDVPSPTTSTSTQSSSSSETSSVVSTPTAVAAAAATATGTPTINKPNTATPPTGTTSAKPSSPSGILSKKILDFARIAVLFIFEHTGALSSATQAEDIIQTFLTGMTPTSNRNFSMSMSSVGSASSTLSGTVVLNFADFTITLSNGTVIGGGIPSSSSSSTA